MRRSRQRRSKPDLLGFEYGKGRPNRAAFFAFIVFAHAPSRAPFGARALFMPGLASPRWGAACVRAKLGFAETGRFAPGLLAQPGAVAVVRA
jgi:hypothetical protein